MTGADNPGRARILDRIRAGLREDRIRAGLHEDSIRAGLRAPTPESTSTPHESLIFELVTDPLKRFQQESAANLIECLLTANPAGSARQLTQVLESLPQGEIFVQDAPSLRRLVEASRVIRPVRWSSQGAPREASQATVTLVEALIAQTGSILVSAACGGRGASVVAPCHIAFATVDQLVPDLKTALGNATRRGILEKNSFACVISGSSRTADIEKILVQGAHGPRRLVVIMEE